jgi:hypothetical protein
MLSWLVEMMAQKPERITVQLVPKDAPARNLPGFAHGGLTLIALRGDTLEKVLANFNTYRSQDSQINLLYTEDGTPIPPRTVLTAPIVCYVHSRV